jgi:hypothetical protein
VQLDCGQPADGCRRTEQGWNLIQKYWKEPTAGNRAARREFLKPEAIKSQYLYGVQNVTLVAPEAYELDSTLLARPGNDEIQPDLFLDYASGAALYSKFQEYFRTKPPRGNYFSIAGHRGQGCLPPSVT